MVPVAIRCNAVIPTHIITAAMLRTFSIISWFMLRKISILIVIKSSKNARNTIYINAGLMFMEQTNIQKP